MPKSQLLSSTNLMSSPTLRVVEIRNEVVDLIQDGLVGEALEVLAHHYTHTSLAEKSDHIKLLLLRSVWNKVEDYHFRCFDRAIEQSLNFVKDAVDEEWDRDLFGLGEESSRLAAHDLREISVRAIKLGKCSALIEMMCQDVSQLSEMKLLYISRHLK